MSKRFGRNQRRRAREELAASQELVRAHARTAGKLAVKSSFQQKSLQDAASRIRMLEQQLDNAKIVIGRHHPAFPAGYLDLGFLPAPRDRFNASTGPRDIATMALMDITANRDVVFNEVHFRLVHGDVVSAYAVSERAMQNTPEEVLCDAITRELVAFTINQYRKVKSGGRG